MIQLLSDKLGYYRVGDLKFYSKLEAIEAMQKTGIHLHWDFNETAFSCYDWTVEPTETISELYKQRAEQLRAQYDYIVLFWSGGADSETVLRSFLDNDIKMDEIVTYSNYDASKNKMDFMNGELFYRTIPKAEKLKYDYPWMKFRILEVSEMTNDSFVDNKFDWIYNMNMFFTPNHVARIDMHKKVKEWADIIDSGKKLCVLWGHDKPRILHENDKFSLRFIDLVDNGPNVDSISGKNPYTDELFYWTPDLPKLVIKQAHIVMKFLKQTHSSPFISKAKSDIAYIVRNGEKHWLSSEGLHNIIYPNWRPEGLDSGKPASILLSPRDNWFFNSDSLNQSKDIWSMGIDKLFKTIPDYWKNDPHDFSKGLKACWSKDYYLE
jgi:hypothetical protein